MDIIRSLKDRVGLMLDLREISRVVVGISGGADSTALLHALAAGRAKVYAVHCNFHLRGEESMRDQRHCENLCRNLRIQLDTVDFDVAKYRESRGVSVETACRELRYDYFRKKMQAVGAQRILVAHNRDDQAETVLMNLFRGAGVRGLGGMLTDTGEIMRPLLEFSRDEILQYLKEAGIDYITDSSNLQSDYRRNFIRNEVLPLIETRWPAAKSKIANTANIMQDQDKENLELQHHFIPHPDILKYDKCYYSRSFAWPIYRFVEINGGSAQIAREITDLIRKHQIKPGKWWRTSTGKRIVAERDGLHAIDAPSSDTVIPGLIAESHSVDETLMKRIKSAPLSELWTDLPPENIELRLYETGDRIKPLGMNGRSRLVSDVLTEAKLTTTQKENATVAVDLPTGEILWIPALKRSIHHLISPTTSTAYRYSLDI